MDAKDLFGDSKLREFGKDYVKLLTIFLKQAGKDSTGALINSIDYNIREEAKQINIIIESNDYLKYVDEGRKPGSYPNIREIEKWVKVKGIPTSAVFPIARSIFRFGIKPTNVIQKTINEIQSPQFIRKYEDIVSENLELIIVEEINKLNK